MLPLALTYYTLCVTQQEPLGIYILNMSPTSFLATEFSKKTGDYKSLSAVDLRVLALTYQLEKEFCNTEHIKNEPSKKVRNVFY